ncbi:hypothetical protein AV521_32155 [Streptomyces sp. IMTB 2501]|uniref:cytochrome P450 n=1 Tax=Streptomyces sp. IMTB 2501 TaxID=1776340 RepID=UPI00096D876D|nr:cytochrome P450 [Streptomyces sp. IMTB 2501]OLZ65341.1 hypothetical protein AV521_32155 [Streptomyces sp. IMTB 2501]
MLVAGSETTATSISWLCHELRRRLAVQSRFRGEVRSALGGRPCAYEDIPWLEYVRRVIHESTRLPTLTRLLMRRSLQEVQLGGISIIPFRFSAGRRKHIGDTLAPSGMTVIVATVVSRRHVIAVRPDEAREAASFAAIPPSHTCPSDSDPRT